VFKFNSSQLLISRTTEGDKRPLKCEKEDVFHGDFSVPVAVHVQGLISSFEKPGH
jgi:hypothetical protein